MSSKLENGILGEKTLNFWRILIFSDAVFGPIFYLAFLAVPVYVQPQFFRQYLGPVLIDPSFHYFFMSSTMVPWRVQGIRRRFLDIK